MTQVIAIRNERSMHEPSLKLEIGILVCDIGMSVGGICLVKARGITHTARSDDRIRRCTLADHRDPMGGCKLLYPLG